MYLWLHAEQDVQVAYYCALTAAVIEFVIGLPATMALVHLESERKALKYVP
jgi:hypothetical protein